MDTRSALLLGSHSVNGIPLTVINCTRWRAPEGKPTCSVLPNPSVVDCAGCAYRNPIVGRHRLRGLGDLVAAFVPILTFGHVGTLQRLVAHLRASFSRRRISASAPAYPGVPARGCGCKQRQAALNRAIPFGSRHAH